MPATAPRKRPYDADHVSVIDDGHHVTALWTPDPAQAANPRGIDLIDRANENVELIATLRRVYKKDGWPYSGWLIIDTVGGDFAPNKREAMKALRHTINGYFGRSDRP